MPGVCRRVQTDRFSGPSQARKPCRTVLFSLPWGIRQCAGKIVARLHTAIRKETVVRRLREVVCQSVESQQAQLSRSRRGQVPLQRVSEVLPAQHDPHSPHVEVPQSIHVPPVQYRAGNRCAAV